MGNETFKVGEIALMHGLSRNSELNGTECEIIGPLGTWMTKRHGPSWGYRVRTADGRTGPTEPRFLRKRRPPQDWVKLCNLISLPQGVEIHSNKVTP